MMTIRPREPMALGVRRAASAFLALVMAVLVLACDSNSGPNYADFGGTWSAHITASTGNTFPVTLSLTQERDQLQGTFTDGGNINGTIDGVASGDSASFQAEQLPPCVGTFQGDVTLVAPNRFEGTYGGTGCTGPLTATITATR